MNDYFSDDVADAIARQARSAVLPDLQRLQNENARLQQHVARADANETYRLPDEQIGPDLWRAINVSEPFIRWLALPDSYSGRPRGEWLRAAFNRGNDAPRVAAIFLEFISQHPELVGGGNAANDNRAPRQREESVVTNKDLDRFYERVRQGVYAGKQQQKDAEEARLHRVLNEGRFRRV